MTCEQLMPSRRYQVTQLARKYLLKNGDFKAIPHLRIKLTLVPSFRYYLCGIWRGADAKLIMPQLRNKRM